MTDALRRSAAALAVALGLGPSVAAAAEVLAIHSYHPGYAWDQGWAAGLEAGLPSHSVTHFYMDTKRLPKAKFAARAEAAWAAFEAGSYDLVVLGDDNATRLVGPRLVEASDVPVVFHGINATPRRYFDKAVLGRQVTGVLERPLMGVTALVIRRMLPEAERVLVLLDEGVTGRASKRRVDRAGEMVPQLTVDTKLLGSFPKWQRQVTTAKERGYDVLIPALYERQRRPDGSAVPDSEVIAWTHQNTPVPMFGFWGFAVGPGKAMAGVVLDGRAMGEAAAEQAATLLSGGATPSITRVDEGRLVVSRSGLKRWGLQMPEFERMDVHWVD